MNLYEDLMNQFEIIRKLLSVMIFFMALTFTGLLYFYFQFKKQTRKIMTDFSQLENEVAENNDVVASAVVLLNSLKEQLDAAGTDPVKLKELSDALSNQTDSLAAAVAANTPAAPEV